MSHITFTQALNLFLSLCLARATAQNKAALLKLGITHVLNAAHSKRGSIGNQSFYGNDFVYCGIPADDSTHFDLDVYFKPAADFIHKALKSPGGKTPLSLSSNLNDKLLVLSCKFLQRKSLFRAVSP